MKTTQPQYSKRTGSQGELGTQAAKACRYMLRRMAHRGCEAALRRKRGEGSTRHVGVQQTAPCAHCRARGKPSEPAVTK